MATNVVETEATDTDAEPPADDEGIEETAGSDGAAANPDSFSVTVHLRMSPTGAAARRQQTVLERLRDLDADGTIPGLTIERWGSRVNVPASETDQDDDSAVELYDEFERVADSAGLQLEPFFEARKAVGGLLSSGPPTERIIVFPVVSITIRRDDELTGLYPCWNDGVHESVEDCLDALATSDTVENI